MDVPLRVLRETWLEDLVGNAHETEPGEASAARSGAGKVFTGQGPGAAGCHGTSKHPAQGLGLQKEPQRAAR